MSDTDFDRDFGGALRPFMGGLVGGLVEAGGEDVVGTDIPKGVAAIFWIAIERVNKKYSINIKPWQHGKWVLNLAASLLKEIDPPAAIKNAWYRAAGKALDVAWSGVVDGVRLRANDHLHAWANERDWKKRKALMGDSYAKAEAFVDKFLPSPDAKTTKTAEGETVVAVNGRVFGTHPDYDSVLREMEESTVDATRARATELGGLWSQFPVDLPRHADVVMRASNLGFLHPDDITRALLGERTGASVTDPEDTTKQISRQGYSLKVLAGVARARLDAAPPPMLVAPKGEPPKAPAPEPFVAGPAIVFERTRALQQHEEARGWFVGAIRPYLVMLGPVGRAIWGFLLLITWPFRVAWRRIQVWRARRAAAVPPTVTTPTATLHARLTGAWHWVQATRPYQWAAARVTVWNASRRRPPPTP